MTDLLKQAAASITLLKNGGSVAIDRNTCLDFVAEHAADTIAALCARIEALEAAQKPQKSIGQLIAEKLSGNGYIATVICEDFTKTTTQPKAEQEQPTAAVSESQPNYKAMVEASDMNDRALAAIEAESAVSEPLRALMDITLESSESLSMVRDMVLQDDGELTAIRLLLGDGHSGFGLYIASVEYPEEGAVLLSNTIAPAQPKAEQG